MPTPSSPPGSAGSTSRSTRSPATASSRSPAATRCRRCCAGSRRSPPTSGSGRSRSTRSRCATSPSARSCGFVELARTSDYQVRFIEFMPLDADGAWTADAVLTGAEIRALIEREHELDRGRAGAVGDRARLPLRRRRRRDRLHQPGQRAVLLRLQPASPDRRGQAPDLPVLDPRDRPARPAARWGERRRDRADRPRRRLAQGAQAPRRRAGLPPAAALDERNRRLTRPRPRSRKTPALHVPVHPDGFIRGPA